MAPAVAMVLSVVSAFPVAASPLTVEGVRLASLDLDDNLDGNLDRNLAEMPVFDGLDEDAPPGPADMPISEVISATADISERLVAVALPDVELVAATVREASLHPNLEERFWDFIAAARAKARHPRWRQSATGLPGAPPRGEHLDLGQVFTRFVEAAKKRARPRSAGAPDNDGFVAAR